MARIRTLCGLGPKNGNGSVTGKITVAVPHHFDAAPALGKKFDAAPAPRLLFTKPTFSK
jgi:hypothetical protein